jgi:hypothetical protein
MGSEYGSYTTRRVRPNMSVKGLPAASVRGPRIDPALNRRKLSPAARKTHAPGTAVDGRAASVRWCCVPTKESILETHEARRRSYKIKACPEKLETEWVNPTQRRSMLAPNSWRLESALQGDRSRACITCTGFGGGSAAVDHEPREALTSFGTFLDLLICYRAPGTRSRLWS